MKLLPSKILVLSGLFMATEMLLRAVGPPPTTGPGPGGGGTNSTPSRPVTAFTGGGASRTPVYTNPYFRGHRNYMVGNLRYGRQRVVILPARDLRGARVNLRLGRTSPNSSIFNYRGNGVGVR